MIPDKVKILGHEYEVRFDSQLVRSRANIGECDTVGLVITIQQGIPASCQHEVFLHEILEALKYRLDLSLDHKTLGRLSEGLFSVLIETGAWWNNDSV